MSYKRPTFDALKQRIFADLSTLADVLRDAFSSVWAKTVHSLHGHLEWVDAQCSPLTCELERLYDWAALYAVTRLVPVAATGTVIATGNIGAFILVDTILRADNGLDYVVISAVELVAGNNLVSVRCVTQGPAGNLDPNAVLVLVDPIAGVNSEVIVSESGITGGAELEDLDAWRLRVVDEWQVMVSRGGRSGKIVDYKAWSKNAHPSVTTALVQPHTLGLGTVIVRPICNKLDNRLPTPAIIAAIEAKLTELAPATADWRVVAPLLHQITVSLDLFAEVDSQANRDAITAAILATVLAEQKEDSVIAMAELDAAIASVTTQYTRLSPLADVPVATGAVFILNQVQFT